MEAECLFCKLSSFVLKCEDTDSVEGSSIAYLWGYFKTKLQ